MFFFLFLGSHLLDCQGAMTYRPYTIVVFVHFFICEHSLALTKLSLIESPHPQKNKTIKQFFFMNYIQIVTRTIGIGTYGKFA